jgi:hypothetical protein
MTFWVGQPTLVGLSHVCKICKVPPVYIVIYGAKIYYVFGIANMTRTCINLGLHEHPEKVGKNQEFKDRIHTLIGKQVKRTPKATNSAIVMQATKELVDEFLIDPKGAPTRNLLWRS